MNEIPAPRHGPLGACEKNRALVFEMNAKGCSLSQIGKAIGTTHTRVSLFLRRNGETRTFPTAWKGERCSTWNGGRVIDDDGYVLLYMPDHPMATRMRKRYVLEHRLVMSNHIGRPLLKTEVVHHRNKKKDDNRIENLELYSSNGEHLRSELKGQCPKWSEDGKARILSALNRRKAQKQTCIHPA